MTSERPRLSGDPKTRLGLIGVELWIEELELLLNFVLSFEFDLDSLGPSLLELVENCGTTSSSSVSAFDISSI